MVTAVRVLRVGTFLAVACSGLVSLAVVGTSASLQGDNVLLSDVRIQGIDVGGKTAEEAQKALEPVARAAVDRTVLLTSEKLTFSLPLAELGARADVAGAIEAALSVGRDDELADAVKERVEALREGCEVPLTLVFDEARARTALTKLATEVNRTAKSAEVTLSGIEIVIAPEVDALSLDIKDCVSRIADVFGRAFEGESAELVVRRKAADITAESFDGYRVIGHFATCFNPGQTNRTENLRLATKSIDGTVVPPGGIFSLNLATGRRIPDRGYRLAPVYSGSRSVLGYGGGVCQVSSTLYNAALIAHQEIVERHSHSRSVPYVPWGRDATVAWGAADMKFRNTTPGPLIVKGWIDGNMIHMCLIGLAASADRAVRAEAGQQPTEF